MWRIDRIVVPNRRFLVRRRVASILREVRWCVGCSVVRSMLSCLPCAALCAPPCPTSLPLYVSKGNKGGRGKLTYETIRCHFQRHCPAQSVVQRTIPCQPVGVFKQTSPRSSQHRSAQRRDLVSVPLIRQRTETPAAQTVQLISAHETRAARRRLQHPRDGVLRRPEVLIVVSVTTEKWKLVDS